MPFATSPGLPSLSSGGDGGPVRRRKAIYEELYPKTTAGTRGRIVWQICSLRWRWRVIDGLEVLYRFRFS